MLSFVVVLVLHVTTPAQSYRIVRIFASVRIQLLRRYSDGWVMVCAAALMLPQIVLNCVRSAALMQRTNADDDDGTSLQFVSVDPIRPSLGYNNTASTLMTLSLVYAALQLLVGC